MSNGKLSVVGGASILGAVFLVAAVFPYHPRIARAELASSLADQPGLPLTLAPRVNTDARILVKTRVGMTPQCL